MSKPRAKRKAPLRATPERWTFEVMTNNGLARIESSGPIDPNLGEALRVLQIHITRLSRSERDTLFALTAHVVARTRKAEHGGDP